MKIRRNQYFVIAIALIVVVLVASQANLFQQGTVISVSQIYVVPQGREVGGEWTGSFWNIVASVQANDNLAGVVLPEDTEGSVTIDDVTTALKTGAKIEIRIDPGEPYLIRKLEEKTAFVSPRVGETYVSRYSITDRGETFEGEVANEVWLNYYEWDEPSWRLYTPFTVTIYKDGKIAGSATLNTEGEQSNIAIIETDEGSVRIENLGGLSGQYLSPNTPAEIAIFKGYPKMYNLASINSLIRYDYAASYIPYSYDTRFSLASGVSGTYTSYWWGTSFRVSSNKHPFGIIGWGTQPTTIISSAFGGWERKDDGSYFRVAPVAPVITESEKTSEMGNAYSLCGWLENVKGVNNLAESIFSYYEDVNIITEGSQKAIKLAIPWSAYGTPLVNIKVPTELADTWVDRPPVSNVQIEATWEKTGTKYVDISGSQRLKVVCSQNAEFIDADQAGGATISISADNNVYNVYPLDQTISLKSGENKTVYFEVSNAGTVEEQKDVPITVYAYDTFLGEETDRDVVYGTFLPTLITDHTYLNILAVEKGTDKKITGLQMQVLYPIMDPVDSDPKFTDSNGELALTLQAEQGGAFVGDVSIKTVETERYESAYYTKNIPQPGVYDVLLEVRVKGEEYPEEFDWWWLLIVFVVVMVVAVVVASRRKKGKTRKRKKRRLSKVSVPSVGVLKK